jgi:hypothetical protein
LVTAIVMAALALPTIALTNPVAGTNLAWLAF